jgi:RNA polymerase sigma-70 factor (ECF subfamily)
MALVGTRFAFNKSNVADPDVALMLRVQDDVPGAFSELIDLYWGRLFGRFFRQFGDRQEAEDLVQDVFLRIYRNRKRYRPQAKFSTWIFHIARNVARNAIRTRRRRHVMPLAQLSGHDKSMSFDRVCDVEAVPSSCLEEAELALVVRRAVSELKGRQRRAVELQCQDHSYAEIADALEMTPKAAKSLLYRARNELRESLQLFVDSTS